MLLSFVTDKNEMVTIVVDSLDQLTIIEDYDANEAEMIIPIEVEHEILRVGNHINGFCVLVSDDPTPAKATDLVSLGYYALRVAIKDLTIMNTNPLTFKINKLDEDIKNAKIYVNYTRQLRRIQK
jgi:hypothetical protein